MLIYILPIIMIDVLLADIVVVIAKALPNTCIVVVVDVAVISRTTTVSVGVGTIDS